MLRFWNNKRYSIWQVIWFLRRLAIDFWSSMIMIFLSTFLVRNFRYIHWHVNTISKSSLHRKKKKRLFFNIYFYKSFFLHPFSKTILEALHTPSNQPFQTTHLCTKTHLQTIFTNIQSNVMFSKMPYNLVLQQ